MDKSRQDDDDEGGAGEPASAPPKVWDEINDTLDVYQAGLTRALNKANSKAERRRKREAGE